MSCDVCGVPLPNGEALTLRLETPMCPDIVTRVGLCCLSQRLDEACKMIREVVAQLKERGEL